MFCATKQPLIQLILQNLFWVYTTSCPPLITLIFIAYFTFPFILIFIMFIMYRHITPNTIYYYSHTFSFRIFTFSIMYTAWCLTLYHNPIYCWALLIHNYFNLIPMPLYHSHMLFIVILSINNWTLFLGFYFIRDMLKSGVYCSWVSISSGIC